MERTIASMALAVTLALAGSARADVLITWQENGPGDLGVSRSFTQSGFTLTATAYQGGGVNQSGYGNLTGTWSASPASANDLYAKNGGGTGNSSETGLGLTSDKSGEHEITYGYGILIDFSKVKMDQPYTISFASVQSSSGDMAGVYDVATGKLFGMIDAGGLTSITIGPGATDDKYLITEVAKPHDGDPNPNILLGEISVTPTEEQVIPEPSTLAIWAVGALALVGCGLHRPRSKASRVLCQVPSLLARTQGNWWDSDQPRTMPGRKSREGRCVTTNSTS
jgi:hypothetical protein